MLCPHHSIKIKNYYKIIIKQKPPKHDQKIVNKMYHKHRIYIYIYNKLRVYVYICTYTYIYDVYDVFHSQFSHHVSAAFDLL